MKLFGIRAAILALVRPYDGLNEYFRMCLDAPFEVRNTITLATADPRRQHVKKCDLERGFLIERQHRAGVEMFKRLLEVVMVKHVLIRLLVAAGCDRPKQAEKYLRVELFGMKPDAPNRRARR